MKHLRLVDLYLAGLSVLSLTVADFRCELVGVDLRIPTAYAENQGNNNRNRNNDNDNVGGGDQRPWLDSGRVQTPWLSGGSLQVPEPAGSGGQRPRLKRESDVQVPRLKRDTDVLVPWLKRDGDQVPEPPCGVAQVPEPATLALLGLGVTGLYVYRRRTRG